MHRLVLVFSALTALVGFGCNERSRESGPEGLREAPSETAATSSSTEHSMTGCLQKGDTSEVFILTDDVGLRIAQITEAAPNLAPHVGHKVEITGSSITNPQSHAMKVTAVNMIAPTCP